MRRKSCPGKCLGQFPGLGRGQSCQKNPESAAAMKSADTGLKPPKTRTFHPDNHVSANYTPYIRTARTSALSAAGVCAAAESGRLNLWTAWARVVQIRFPSSPVIPFSAF
jgi:hypothetical protein